MSVSIIKKTRNIRQDDKSASRKSKAIRKQARYLGFMKTQWQASLTAS